MGKIGELIEKLTVNEGRRVRVICGDGKKLYLVRGKLNFEDEDGWFVSFKDRGVGKTGLVDKGGDLEQNTLDGKPLYCFLDGEFVARFIGANRSQNIPEKTPELIEKVIGRRLLKGVTESLAEPKMNIVGIPIKWILILGGVGVIGYFVYSMFIKGEPEPAVEGVRALWQMMVI